MSEPGADETGWVAATDGMAMLRAGWQRISARKLGCFFLTCAETLLRNCPAADRSTAVLPQVWAVLDGEQPREARPEVGEQEGRELLHRVLMETQGESRHRVQIQSDIVLAAGLMHDSMHGGFMWWLVRMSTDNIGPSARQSLELFELRRERIVAEHYHHLRDIAGNPFRPVAFDPSWRTEAVVSLARGMYEARDFAAMPVLTDPLEDAGCANTDILAHCRTPGVHVRGCWVVDLVLGKG